MNMNSIKPVPVPSSERQENIINEDQGYEGTNENEQNGGSENQEPPLKKKRTASFLDADSSLMKQVALISTMVGAQITAAAAEAAVAVLSDEMSCPREIFDGNQIDVTNGLLSPTSVYQPERAHNDEESEMKERFSPSESQVTSPKKNDVPLPLRIRAAVATGLGAAAAHAKLLAEQEEREIEHLVATIVEAQLKKLHSKIKHCEDAELLMEKKYAAIEELKEYILGERINILQRTFNAGISKLRDHSSVQSQSGNQAPILREKLLHSSHYIEYLLARCSAALWEDPAIPLCSSLGVAVQNRFVFKENVAGKVVLITGASSGIGEYLAYEYARRGARLALVARRTDRLQKVADDARQLGSPDVIVITADVSKIEDCKRFVNKTVNHFGQLDHLVNNAGIAHEAQLFKEMSNISDFVPVMDINFWGSLYGTHFAVPHLRKSRGKIIVMSSSAGWLYPPKASIYSASKAAQIGLYESLRAELGPEIGITIVTPGFVDSEMTQGNNLKKSKIQFLKNEPTDVCAKAIVESTCRGDMYLTEPFWMRPLFLLKVLCPELWDWTSYWLIVHGRRISDKKA
ncbi:hypothetical protein CRYUN_Cryun07bG0018500 [Craigia yunnanensis]